jgi:elongation factor Ts
MLQTNKTINMSEITKQMIMALRAKTGAGIGACQKALQEANGLEEEAIIILKKQGVASASKRSLCAAQEGIIYSYIHNGSKLGVLIEVNCETDFVARSEEFKQFVADISMQIAAANPLYIRKEDVPPEILQQEKEIVLAQCEGKPAQALDKIIEGRIQKWYTENCLLEQPFVKDSKVTIEELRVALSVKIGENVVVKRFARFQLGE